MLYRISTDNVYFTPLSTIIIQLDGDLVILIDNIVTDIASPLYQEILGPDHLG